MLVRVAIAVVLLLLPTAVGAQTERRIALLIGNQSYSAKIGRLKNPHADIALIGAALRSLAFTVTEVKDASYKAIDTAIKRHIKAVRGEGEGTISFIYYSGHGAADPDTKINYLIPTDVSSADDENLWINSLNLNNIIENVREQAPLATHYVVFDACRNELNLTRKGQKALSGKGFVPLAYTPGVMIAYATAPGRTASDIGQEGGPYARALSEEIVKPGAEALFMFRRVALRVNREIGQDPWISASTLPEVYFAGKKPEGPTPEQQLEMAFWASVKDNTDPQVLKTYLDRYPDGSFATAAHALMDQQEQRIKAEAAAREAQRKRAEEARKAAELKRKEEEKRARDARLAEERRHAEEAHNAAEVRRLEEQQRQEALLHAEELRKAYKEIETAKEAVKIAEEQRIADMKALEEARQVANLALANPANLKAGVRPPQHSDVQLGGLFSEADAKRVRAHAGQHGLIVPDFKFELPGDDVPLAYRRFVGVWVDEGLRGRRLMMIITRVGKEGNADGYWTFGPPSPTGVTQDPASLFKVAGRISEDTLRFSSPGGGAHYKHTISGKNLNYTYANTRGQTASAIFIPLWTLVEAQQPAKP
jgi:caspase domain-containing protein